MYDPRKRSDQIVVSFSLSGWDLKIIYLAPTEDHNPTTLWLSIFSFLQRRWRQECIWIQVHIYFFIMLPFCFVIAWSHDHYRSVDKILCQVVYFFFFCEYICDNATFGEVKSINWYRSHRFCLIDSTTLECKFFDDFDPNICVLC